MKSNSLPELVELALAVDVEDELVERCIVAEVARHAMKARASRAARRFAFPAWDRGKHAPAPRRQTHRERPSKIGHSPARTGRRRPRWRARPGAGRCGVPFVNVSGRSSLDVPAGDNAYGSPRTGGSSRARAAAIRRSMPRTVRFLHLRHEPLSQLDHEVSHPLAARASFAVAMPHRLRPASSRHIN